MKVGYHISNTPDIEEVNLNVCPTGFWMAHTIQDLETSGAWLRPNEPTYIYEVMYDDTHKADRDDYEKLLTDQMLQSGKQVIELEDCSTIVDTNCIQEITQCSE